MTNVLTMLQPEVGVTRYSDWLLIDQSMIDLFAKATLDCQFIHVDPARAAETPFGGTIAHGFLTLSLLSHLTETIVRAPALQIRMGVNYGFDRVRFVHPVRSGGRIRAASTLTAIEEKRPGQFQQTCDVVIEIDGVEKPALTATWLSQFFI